MKIKSLITLILLSMFTGISLFGQEPAFKISLAEWSLNRTLRKGTITNMDFPRIPGNIRSREWNMFPPFKGRLKT